MKAGLKECSNFIRRSQEWMNRKINYRRHEFQKGYLRSGKPTMSLNSIYKRHFLVSRHKTFFQNMFLARLNGEKHLLPQQRFRSYVSLCSVALSQAVLRCKTTGH